MPRTTIETHGAGIGLSASDVERYAEVSGLSEAKWVRLTTQIAQLIRGSSAIVGFGAAGLAAWAMAATSIVLALLSFPLALLVIAIPVLEARRQVTTAAIKRGFSVGVVLALFGYGRYFFSTFIDESSYLGAGQAQMLRYAQRAYNGGLVLGYGAAARLSDRERKDLRDALTRTLIQEAGAVRTMESWSDTRLVLEYARVFCGGM